MAGIDLAELWTAQQCADADRHAIDVIGIPSSVLMERAALAVSAEVQALWAEGGAREVLVLCGPGNNGADGLAVARQLHHRGTPAKAHIVTPRFSDAIAEQLAWARACGVSVEMGVPEGKLEGVLVVDALLGTGSRGPPRGAVGLALEWTELGKAAGRLAIDVPSGVDPDTGATGPIAFKADCTVTFVRSKPGLHITPGSAHAGRVVVADIGIGPASRRESGEVAHGLIGPTAVAHALGSLGRARHKGDRGHVCVVGGSEGYFGAPLLSALAALRVGAGLTTIASPAAALESLSLHRPEVMACEAFDGESLRGDVLVVGPGLADRRDRSWLAGIGAHDKRPAVWDANGLDELPTEPGGPRIITPHPGEAGRLLSRAMGTPVAAHEVQAHRVEAARSLALQYRAIVVLKGEGTVVVSADGTHLRVACSGSSTLSSAGTGDVLAGAIAGLWARGLAAFDAACVGVHLHGLAGERRPLGTIAAEIADGLEDWTGLAESTDLESLTPRRWPRFVCA